MEFSVEWGLPRHLKFNMPLAESITLLPTPAPTPREHPTIAMALCLCFPLVKPDPWVLSLSLCPCHSLQVLWSLSPKDNLNSPACRSPQASLPARSNPLPSTMAIADRKIGLKHTNMYTALVSPCQKPLPWASHTFSIIVSHLLLQAPAQPLGLISPE